MGGAAKVTYQNHPSTASTTEKQGQRQGNPNFLRKYDTLVFTPIALLIGFEIAKNGKYSRVTYLI